MIRIFKYEFRIILCKIYVPVMLAASLIYSRYLLSTETILGVSDTAPFSGWSFGKYLGDCALINMLITLLIIAFSFSERQKKAGMLTDVTAFPPKKRILIRSILIGGFFIFSMILSFLLGCIFLWRLFGEIHLGNYLSAWGLICLPCVFLITGVGMLLGRKSPALIYVLMLICLVMAFAFKGAAIDINGADYYMSMAAGLGDIEKTETAFMISSGYLITRLVYLFIGLGAYALVDVIYGGKKRKDTE
ncbi:MAG: hypothetical protein IJM34_07605 [Lachnospiraceae bacterium]|nr:hypothetical protein [Lachnospiraceae bacterium]